ncbi:MAG: hypothetical protein EYR95_18135 [Phormidium sp. SL48-SHIP]|nr:MAG: hypothetical protein EYR95_18135 [Phormidium sp. SL48-SHIP]
MITILRFILFFLVTPALAIVAQAAGTFQDDFRIVDTGFWTESVIVDCVGDEICHYDSSGALLHQRKSIDGEDDISRYQGLKTLGATGPLFSFLAEFVAANKTVVIGENMKRVNRYADNFGGTTIDTWLNGRKWTPQLNDDFIATMKAQGREIKDIGPDFSRRLRNRANPSQGRPPSDIYGGERRELLDYDNYQRLYERSGRYEGGVPGFD